MTLIDETLANQGRLTDLTKNKTSGLLETWIIRSFDPFDDVVVIKPDGDPVVEAESVEGLPLSIVRLYADIAVRHAVYDQVDDGVWVATVAAIEGAWGDGDTPEEAKQELHEAIIGWVAVKRRVGATMPAMEGLDLNEKH